MEFQNGCSYELRHHGIKDQKWGVRRYQNYDGSYTKAGKLRREKLSNGLEIRENKKTLTAKALGKLSPKIREEQEKYKDYNVYDSAGKKVGNISTYMESSESMNIVWLGINEKERGKHYAQSLMDFTIEDAKSKGFKELTLEVPGSSPDARHIYEKKGFIAGEKISDEDDVWGGLTKMRKDLR